MNELIDQLIDILNVEESTDSEKIDQIYDLLQKFAAESEEVKSDEPEAEDLTDEEVLKAVEG